MRLTRIHVPGPLGAGGEIVLPAQAGEHLTRVLRLDAGAPFTLFDGHGGEYAADARRAQRQTGTCARARRMTAIERESPLDVTLLQGVARGERMDLIVQKATELGVARIVPVLTERSVVKLDAKQRERKREHWQSIAPRASSIFRIGRTSPELSCTGSRRAWRSKRNGSTAAPSPAI